MDDPPDGPSYAGGYEYDVKVAELLAAMACSLCMAVVPALLVLDRKMVLPVCVWIVLIVAALAPYVHVATLRPPWEEIDRMAKEAEEGS